MTTNELNTNLEQVTGKLKKEDSNYARIVKAVQVFYWIFIPLFAFKTIREYSDSGDLKDIISGACITLAFLIIALTFGKYYKEYKYVDYSLPTLEMLKKAAYRYEPLQKRSAWILVALVFMDIGLIFDWTDANTSVLHSQLIFLSGILIGVVIGMIWWYIQYKPLRDDALRLIKELEC